MADSSSLINQLDSQLEQFFAGWNIYTTLICLTLVTYLVYPLFFTTDPDTHPLLLARQSSTSHVRQPGESAIYRSLETPHGYPLRTGLNVKDPGAQKWTSGRDGDLRDVWRQAVKGPVGPNGDATGAPGKVLAVMGTEEVIPFTFGQMTKEINAIGEFLKGHGRNRVAIYLPNSVELLITFFAAAFYGLTPILVPQGQSIATLAKILKETQADVLVAAAGAIPLEELLSHYANLKQVIWVAERSSRHMEWNEVPEGVGGKADIAVWHDVIDEKADSASSDPPANASDNTTPSVIAIWQGSANALENYELVEFTQASIVAAVAAQISILPKPHRLGPSDLVLPLDSLSLMYPLTVTLAALFSNASIAITPVSGRTAEYDTAFRGIFPTVIVASAETMSKACADKKTAAQGAFQALKYWRQARALASGVMPTPPANTPKPRQRLIFVSHRVGAKSSSLSPAELFDLRILTNARIVYALTAAKVAGAISQTNVLDYRMQEDTKGASHFGPPLSCLEVMFKDTPDHKTQDDGNPQGWLVVNGPAVVGQTSNVGVLGTMRDDNTLELL